MIAMNGIFKWVYHVGDLIGKMIYLHFLWVLFVLLGLGIFGIMPATTSLFAVIRKGIDQGPDRKIFKLFFENYKWNFLKSNLLGLLFLLVSILLYMDLFISENVIKSFWLHLFILGLFCIYSIILLYSFPVLVRYELKLLMMMKQSFFISVARPFETIAIILSLLIVFVLFQYLPILLFFMGAPIIAVPIMWFANRAFIEIEKKKTAFEDTQNI